MDIIEMHELADLLIDKANAPWFNPEEKDLFINLAQVEYLDNSYRLFEYNEEVRDKLHPLVRSQSFAGSVTNVDLSTITDFRYVLSVRGNLPDGCGGIVTRAIPPVQLDDEVRNQRDPFNKNDDRNPGYIQENDGAGANLLQFLSTTNPSDVIVKYLKTPLPVFRDIVTPANNINSELSASSHEEIVNIAVRKMLGNIENQFGYQVQSQESQIQ